MKFLLLTLASVLFLGCGSSAHKLVPPGVVQKSNPVFIKPFPQIEPSIPPIVRKKQPR